MSTKLFVGVCAIVSLSVAFTESIMGQGWTHFRGSRLDAISEVENAPTNWSVESNILWKTEIHGRGWSSPVVWEDQVWITTGTEDGKALYAICANLNTGEIIHDIQLFNPDTVYRKHAVNSYATPTPCVDLGKVFAHFGRYGTACIDVADGAVIWSRTDLECQHVQGPGSSPVIYKDLLILHYEGSDVQFITALDKSNGKTVWKTERPKVIYDKLDPIGKKAYITPLIIQVNGRDLLISNGSALCIAYDPETGKEIWRIVQGVDSTIAMPAFGNDLVYFYTGFEIGEDGEKYAELLAVDPMGSGDITNPQVVWRMKGPILQLSTPLFKDGLLYTIDSRSMLICLDAATGKTHYSQRLKGKFNASPVYAAGHIYCSNTNGNTIVWKEGPKLEIIAENQLDGEIWTTPAVVDNSIIIRTSKSLYRISDD